jgi:uncharacterized protein YcfJ
MVMLSTCNPGKQNVGSLIEAGTGAYVGNQIGNGQLPAVVTSTLLGGYFDGSWHTVN